MLVLTRRMGDGITINTSDGDIKICFLDREGSSIKLGFDAPKEIIIRRDEACVKTKQEGKENEG